jgi:hypothetical protein
MFGLRGFAGLTIGRISEISMWNFRTQIMMKMLHKASLAVLTVSALALVFVSSALANPVTYAAGSPSKGKKLVLLASDHEYRSEETIPALARILAKHHGFDCTVLFGLDANGEVEAGASNIPGLEALKDADGLVIFARFLALPPEQMKHLDAYFNRAGPVVGLRTSTHAFNYSDDKDPYYKYHFRYEGQDYRAGFGHQVLGQTWVGHYGSDHGAAIDEHGAERQARCE